MSKGFLIKLLARAHLTAAATAAWDKSGPQRPLLTMTIKREGYISGQKTVPLGTQLPVLCRERGTCCCREFKPWWPKRSGMGVCFRTSLTTFPWDAKWAREGGLGGGDALPRRLVLPQIVCRKRPGRWLSRVWRMSPTALQMAHPSFWFSQNARCRY